MIGRSRHHQVVQLLDVVHWANGIRQHTSARLHVGRTLDANYGAFSLHYTANWCGTYHRIVFGPLLTGLFLRLRCLFISRIRRLNVTQLSRLYRNLALRAPQQAATCTQRFRTLVFSGSKARHAAITGFGHFNIT